MDFRDRHVVVTGGTGALGTAVVGALVEAGAVCHVPFMHAAEAERFRCATMRRSSWSATANLADEAAVATLYAGVPKLWASIHLAGGFAMAPIGDTTKADLMAQVEMNFVTAFLCCRAAVAAMTRTGAGGRIVNVAARPALEWRTGAGMAAYAASKAAVAALTVALAEEVAKARHPGQRGRAFDHGHAGQPRGHAESRLRRLAEGRGGGGDDPVPGLARQQGHPRRASCRCMGES